MTIIKQVVLKLWAWIISIFVPDSKKSQEPEITGFYRVIVVGFKLAGRLVRYDIVPHRDKDGGFECAILQRAGSPALTPRVLQDIAKYIARDYFRRGPDLMSWVYISVQSKSVTPEDVLEFQFVRCSPKGNMRAEWSVAAPDVARAWISRAAIAIEFGAHISVR